jgi:stearoyl-CoA desaturase (delta-9 desaturase)
MSFDWFFDWARGGLLDATWWQVLVYALIVTQITIASVTLFLHRCQAHRSLDLHPSVSHFFRFWLWMTTGMVTREWAAVHRKHHARCETPDDPHSPQTRGLRKVLLQGAELYAEEANKPETIAKFGHGCPDDWVERNLYTGKPILGVTLMAVINLLLFGPVGISVWALQMLWIPINAAGVINGIGHFWGYRNFDSDDASRNISPWGLLIGGEELHNNHHAFPTSCKFSAKWYEVDLGWGYIKLLSLFGLARVKKVIPKPRLAAPKVRPDGESLAALFAYRHDIMGVFAAHLKRACRDEARRLRADRQAADFRLIDAARRWLPIDSARWTEAQKARIAEVCAVSERLRTLLEMRVELSALWSRSNASAEQLVAQLEAWCRRAESSGMRSLEELSLRVRCYAA